MYFMWTSQIADMYFGTFSQAEYVRNQDVSGKSIWTTHIVAVNAETHPTMCFTNMDMVALEKKSNARMHFQGAFDDSELMLPKEQLNWKMPSATDTIIIAGVQVQIHSGNNGQFTQKLPQIKLLQNTWTHTTSL